MSRCPPPLGPMSWAGRSSICRASSPTVSVLPRQARPHWQKRSIKRGAGLAGLGDTLGSMAPRVRAGTEEGIAECGQRQQVSGWEHVNIQLWCSSSHSRCHQPRQQEGQTDVEGGASPGHWALSPLLLQVCLEWGWYTCLLPS